MRALFLPRRPPAGWRCPAAIDRALPLAIVLIAFAIRVYRLGAVGLDYDEAFSIHAAAMSLPGIFYIVSTFEPHPPLYYSFLHFWYPAFGPSELSLRFPSVIANVLTVVLLVKVADRCYWRAAGLVGAALLALNPFQIWYAQDARMYAPVACFGIAAVYAAMRAARDGKNRHLAAYVICMLLALYTHYYAIFLAVFVNLFVLVQLLSDRRGDERRQEAALASLSLWERVRMRVRARLRAPDSDPHPRPLPEGEGSPLAGSAISLPASRIGEASLKHPLPRWIGAQVVVGALYLPWLAYAYRISVDYSRPAVSLNAMLDVIGQALTEYSLGTSMPADVASRLSLGFLMIVGVGLLSTLFAPGRKLAWRPALFAGGYLLLPMALGLGVSFFRSMFLPRYFMVSAPAFFLLLGLGVVALLRRAWPLGVAATLFLVGAQLLSFSNSIVDRQYDKSEFGEATKYLTAHAQPGDGVILDGWSQATQFWYYHDLRGLEPAPGLVVPIDGRDGWDLTFPRVDETMAAHRGVWLLTYGMLEVDGQHLIQGYLARNDYPVFSHPIISDSVYYYVAPPSTAPTVTPVDDTCGGQIDLKDLETYETSARAGEILPLALRWGALTSSPPAYVVSWRLIDSRGHTVLQRDAEPASGYAPSDAWTPGTDVVDRYGMALPSFLLPGEYQLEIVVFDKASGAPCTFRHAGAPLPSPFISLTPIEVRDAAPSRAIDDPLPSHPADLTLDGLTLYGYDLAPGPNRPGDALSLRLFWRVTTPIAGDDRITARLSSATGTPFGQEDVALGPPEFPTSRWQLGRTIATYLDLPISPRAATGSYDLSLTLTDGRRSTTLSDFPAISVVSRPRSFQVPSIPNPGRASFGGMIDFLGYGLRLSTTKTAHPGQPLSVTLYWQDRQPVGGSYKVFTHLVGPDGKIYGQSDSIPLGGRAPTTGWLPGEVLVDHYTLEIYPGAPPGQYKLVVGFYDPVSGARVRLANAPGDGLTVAMVEVSN